MFNREIILGTALTLGLLTSEAKAQDSWEGYYGGISVSANRLTSDVGSSSVHRFKNETTMLGIYGGYNFVRPNGFVWGPELLLTGLSAKGGATDAGLGTSKFEAHALLSPRIRLGYATENLLVYGVLGLGISDAGAKPSGRGGTDIMVSGAIGFGMEVALKNGWSTKIEAMSYNLVRDDLSFNGSAQKVDTKIQQITLGLTHKF